MEADEISQLLASLRKREAEIVARIETWANINSGTYNPAGVEKMATLLGAELTALSAAVTELRLPPVVEVSDEGRRVERPLGPAIRAVCRPEAPVQVLLSGHLDTVFGAEHPFQTVRREENRLIGPGVADMKGGLAILIEALRILEASPARERIGWEVFLNPDEEIGSPQSAAHLRQAASRADYGLVFEPALPDGNLVSARWGTGNFAVRAKGRAAHAGRDFGKGRSAVSALAEWIVRADDLNKRSGLILNVGRMIGGGAINIVPAEAVCRVNVRIQNEVQVRETGAELNAIADEISRERGVQLSVEGGIARPPKPLTPETLSMLETFKRCARKIGFDLGWAETGGGSDANILAAAGLPVVDGLGVRGGGMHTSQEFLEIESLVERAALTGCFLFSL